MSDYISPILKLTHSCNYTCRFCRYANHPSLSRMQVEKVQSYITKVIKYNLSNDRPIVVIIFHGGEPLLWGLKNFKQIMSFEEACEEKYNIKIVNRIQTNGFLITDEWIGLFKKYNFEVGISLDGPLFMNAHYGKNGNDNSMEAVLNNIRKLKDNRISHGILSVITQQHLGHEEEFYNFWKEAGITNLCLRYCYNPEDQEVIDAELLGDFLIHLFDLYILDDAKCNIRIREFDDAISKLFNNTCRICSNACRERCGKYLMIDSSGMVYFCDELTLENGDSLIGNLNTDSIAEVVDSKHYHDISESCKRILKVRCEKCPVYHICGGGCRRNDINSGQNNYFCRTYIKFYKHVEEVYRGIKREIIFKGDK